LAQTNDKITVLWGQIGKELENGDLNFCKTYAAIGSKSLILGHPS